MSAADIAAATSSIAHRLYAGGDISEAERDTFAASVRILSFVGQHADGLRLLCERLTERGQRAAELDPAHDAALAAHPAVAAVLEAFPGSVIAGVRPLDTTPARHPGEGRDLSEPEEPTHAD